MNDNDEKIVITPVAQMRVPIGGQEIELQQVEYIHGGMAQMRIRIREGRRFTIFDIDPVTAEQWGAAMRDWASVQLANPEQGRP